MLNVIPRRLICFTVFLPLMVLLASCDTQVATSSEQSAQSVIQQGSSKKITHMVLGTGSVQGVYFPIGGVICRLVNRHVERHRIRCTLESTGGSVYNLRQLDQGNFDLVFAQSDWQYNAYHGKKNFQAMGPNNDLRAVFALESDPLALIVKKDSGIKKFDDLADKVVSFGYSRSLQHRIMDDFLEVKGWSHKAFKEVVRLSDTKQVGKLCDGSVEAILFLSSSLNDHLRGLDDLTHPKILNRLVWVQPLLPPKIRRQKRSIMWLKKWLKILMISNRCTHRLQR